MSRSAERLRYTRVFAMSRIGSSHPSVVIQVARLIATALCVAGLGGCGSTIVTRIHTRDVVLSFPIDKRENQARRLEKKLKILPTKPADWGASAAPLVRWAGADAERLTLAAESLLLAHPRGSQEISGFSLAAMDLSWRSLRFWRPAAAMVGDACNAANHCHL